eukprot:6085459-Pyramimonas_sp.AAC.1
MAQNARRRVAEQRCKQTAAAAAETRAQLRNAKKELRERLEAAALIPERMTAADSGEGKNALGKEF